ncbi:hypothetical protein Tco_1277979, partial [Tanacetum coccineum]
MGQCNLRLKLPDVTSKEATLQVVFEVLILTLLQGIPSHADAPEDLYAEFLASAYIADVNVNKLHQPWRSFAAIINKCLSGKPSYDSLRLSQAQILWGVYNKKNIDYAYLLGRNSFSVENKKIRETKCHLALCQEDDPMFTTINVISRNEDTQLNKFLQRTKGARRKLIQLSITKQKLPTAPKEIEVWKRKLMTTENWCYTRGSRCHLDYDSEDDISWKSSDNDQDDEQAQDDEDADRNDVNETTQNDEDDDDHDDDEKLQDDDDDEEQTESEDDGDDFVDPKLTTHDDDIIHEEETNEDDSFDPTIHTPSRISSSDDEDSDNEVEGANVEGAKSDEDATYEEDQGNEAVEDTNTNLDGRDDVMTDVILPQVQATQEIEDTHVTLTPVNPDGQQQSSSVSSGFVSNMLNPNQDTGVDDIFGQHTEATSLIDTPVTAIMEPSFTAQINRPPTPYPLVIQTQQPPILTPATTTSSSLQNLPNFASLFGFDYRLKALEDNFSELRQTNQYAEALSSIPSIVDQYLAKFTTANQQFLDSIDEGMKKIIKEQFKKEVSKITPKIEKLVTDQLKSEVLVRSSKEANTSHAVAANLSELELKKILIDKMEANNSINRSDIQRQLYKTLVDAYEADKILLDTYGDTVTIKRPRDGAYDDQEPSTRTDR